MIDNHCVYCNVTITVESGRQYVPPSKAVLNVLSDPAKPRHSFMDQRSQSDTDMAVSVRLFICAINSQFDNSFQVFLGYFCIS